MVKSNRNLKYLIDKILTHAFGERMFTGMRRGNPRSKPGELIKKLTPEEREILKDAKSEDFNHVRDVKSGMV